MNAAMLQNNTHIICPLAGVSGGYSSEHRNPEGTSVFGIGDAMEKPSAYFLMRNAPMRIHKISRGEERRVLLWDRKRYIYSNVLWNFLNPKNKLTDNDVTHHIDGDQLNDLPSNIQKLTRREHAQYHAKNRTEATRLKISQNAKIRYAKRTHCKNGHPLSGDNLRLKKSKGSRGECCGRVCKTCSRIYTRDRRRLKDAEGNPTGAEPGTASEWEVRGE